MAILSSVGRHEPTGLQYLVAEGLLHHDCAKADYEWFQTITKDPEAIVEEVLRVGSSVVWSRNGKIIRVFSLNIEDEKVLHALVAYFPIIPTIDRRFDTNKSSRSEHLEPALVVVLQTQIHVFTLSGGFHVIPLNFRVTRAVAGPVGVLLQSGLKPESIANSGRAPEARWERVGLQPSKASFLFPSHSIREGRDHVRQSRQPTYCLPDVLSDIGVITTQHSRRYSNLDELPLLSSSEQLMYASNKNELLDDTLLDVKDVALAVTKNATTGLITIWQIQHRGSAASPVKARVDPPQQRNASHGHESRP
ncbi:Anaphase-promoting complex subunit 1, partial [Elasticomyces elasticus]